MRTHPFQPSFHVGWGDPPRIYILTNPACKGEDQVRRGQRSCENINEKNRQTTIMQLHGALAPLKADTSHSQMITMILLERDDALPEAEASESYLIAR
ncbi:hypothetical protein QOT17_002807 [Balamuthia mandrillaris]